MFNYYKTVTSCVINHFWILCLSAAKIFTVNRQKTEKFIKIKKINRNFDEIFHGL